MDQGAATAEDGQRPVVNWKPATAYVALVIIAAAIAGIIIGGIVGYAVGHVIG